MRKTICGLGLLALCFTACGAPPKDAFVESKFYESASVDLTAAEASASATPGDSLVNSVTLEAQRGHANSLALSELALRKSSSLDVQATARTLIKGHQNTDRKLRRSVIVALPLTPTQSAEQKRVEHRLHGLRGSAFDLAYAEAVVSAHERELRFYRRQSSSAPTEALRAYFAEAIPAVESELRESRKLRDGL